MKKALFISIFSCCLAFTAVSQQSPHFTQYMFNRFVINPAFAGTGDYYQIRSNHRFQWVGITDAPVTNMLSFYGPHKKQPMGFGGYIYNDATGPTSRTGLNGSYSYNIKLMGETRLSFGLSLGIMQYRLDGTQLTIKDQSDMAIQPVVYNSWLPDAAFGMYAYNSKWYAGFSINQLLNNSIKLYKKRNGLNKLKSHFYLAGGYKHRLSKFFQLEPSVILKSTSPGIYQFDITTRAIYKDIIWGGLSYRYNDAISILIGHVMHDKIVFGYAYDIGFNKLSHYNSGTHEFMIGYRFKNFR